MNWFSKLFGRHVDEQISEFDPAAQDFADGDAPSGNGAAVPPVIVAPAARKSTHSLPRFSTGGQARGVPAAQADRMRKLRAAFTPSHPISDASLFAGRRELLLRLIHLIEDQKLHVVLYGDRGIGKTSVLRVLSSLAREAHYNVMYASCGSDTDFDSLFRSIARDVPLLYHADYEPTHEEVEAGGVFADLLPDRPITVADLTTLFEGVRGTQLLIIIDEFDRVESNRMREQVAELIKNLSDRGVSVQCLIAGVASNLTALVSHIPSIRRNLIGLPIGPLGEAEVRDVIRNAALRSNISFSDSAEAMMVRFSTGLPYLAQLLGLHASLLAVRADRDEVSEEDVLGAVGHAVDEIRLRISPRGARITEAVAGQVGWERLGELARRALLQVGDLSDEDIAGLDERSRTELLVRFVDDESTRWSFAEEAVIPFIWLNARLAEATPARDAASRAFQQLERASAGPGGAKG